MSRCFRDLTRSARLFLEALVLVEALRWVLVDEILSSPAEIMDKVLSGVSIMSEALGVVPGVDCRTVEVLEYPLHALALAMTGSDS